VCRSEIFFLWVGKFSSFGFAKRWFVCRAKPNVLNVQLDKIELIKMCSGENKKYRSVGKECRLA
jgi:hypothetical protein